MLPPSHYHKLILGRTSLLLTALSWAISSWLVGLAIPSFDQLYRTSYCVTFLHLSTSSSQILTFSKVALIRSLKMWLWLAAWLQNWSSPSDKYFSSRSFSLCVSCPVGCAFFVDCRYAQIVVKAIGLFRSALDQTFHLSCAGVWCKLFSCWSLCFGASRSIHLCTSARVKYQRWSRKLHRGDCKSHQLPLLACSWYDLGSRWANYLENSCA